MEQEEVSLEEDQSYSSIEKIEEADIERMHEEMVRVLSLFGTAEARKNFMELLDLYREIYIQHKVSEMGQQIKQQFGRSQTHNQIMDILKRLALSAKPNSVEQRALANMADRNTTHRYIVSYYEAEGKKKQYKSPMAEFRERGAA